MWNQKKKKVKLIETVEKRLPGVGTENTGGGSEDLRYNVTTVDYTVLYN